MENSIEILNAEKIKVLGVDSVIDASETQIKASTALGMLHIAGKGLKVEKLDIETKVLEASGKVFGVKYSEPSKSLLKRLFK